MKKTCLFFIIIHYLFFKWLFQQSCHSWDILLTTPLFSNPSHQKVTPLCSPPFIWLAMCKDLDRPLLATHFTARLLFASMHARLSSINSELTSCSTLPAFDQPVSPDSRLKARNTPIPKVWNTSKTEQNDCRKCEVQCNHHCNQLRNQ